MSSNLQKITELVLGVHNPVVAVLDRLGLRRSPYILRLRNGHVMELRPKTGDLFGFYEIVLRRDYFAAGQVIKPGATVIDVGANIGCFTITAAKLAGPTGRVIAIEPEESTYQQLLGNIKLNKLDNVTALRLAVGATEGEILLHSDPNRLFSSVFSSVNGRPIGGSDQRVPMVTLDSLMDKYRIERCDYLKLDCEGAEHEIVANMSFATASRVAQITMEVHKVPGCDSEILTSRLENFGYQRIGTSTLPFYALSPLGGVV
ncbi:MAG: FkbM family methyltransferase [Rhodoferax sp.]|uniref:FkbM family methyltransferase n=1 Tax=Rhodoferax sp. TaxID=50421 RepID=UPI002717270B|nr:FkbM family methyltransferase [Rhodoferax sp.]MDO8450871.1 FkbM family methyltransferase [Rhodoferax sp.]